VTPEDLDRIDSTVERLRVAADADALARAFYARLFDLDPGTRALFVDDLTAQRESFVTTLTEIASSIRDLGELSTRAGALGSRHATYGVRPGHYEAVRAALLGAFDETFGERFTEDDRHAWARAYDLIAEVMQQAPQPARPMRRISDRG
jgi:nitric oxide dioxygenase